MNKKLLLLVPVIGFAGLSFLTKEDRISTYHADGIEGVTFSSNPPAAKTGAPGEGKCTDCHMGEAMSGDGVVFFTVSGGPSYTPGSTYPVTVSVLDGASNGFEMTIIDAEGNQAGSFEAGANSNVTTSGGREYVRQNAAAGETSWTFNWTAPATEMGELTAYYAVNKANNDGSTNGDEIFLGQESIPLLGASIVENPIDKAYKVFFNEQTEQLNLSYSLMDDAKVVLNVQDLSGKLIQYYDLGNQGSGDYNEILPLTQVDAPGVYLISLFVDNMVFNRKVMLR